MPDCLLGATREGPTQANGRAIDTGFPKSNPNELSQSGRARVPLVPFPFSQQLRPYRKLGPPFLPISNPGGHILWGKQGVARSARLVTLPKVSFHANETCGGIAALSLR